MTVKYSKNNNKWEAFFNGKSLGLFNSIEEAQKAAEQEAILNEDYSSLDIYSGVIINK